MHREIPHCFSNGCRSFLRAAATIAVPGKITTMWTWTRVRSWRSSERNCELRYRRNFAVITTCWCPRRTMQRFRCHPQHRRPWTPTTSNCWPSMPHKWSRTARTWLTPSMPFCRRSSTINHLRRVRIEIYNSTNELIFFYESMKWISPFDGLNVLLVPKVKISFCFLWRRNKQLVINALYLVWVLLCNECTLLRGTFKYAYI